MKQLYRILILCLSLLLTHKAFAQSKQELAKKKAEEAIKLMDSGKLDESIVLLKQAQNLDPEDLNYPYEIALATYMKKDYQSAIVVLEKLTTHDKANDRVYQLLGNAYSSLGKPEEAIVKYNAGLEKFPTSGILFMEKGTIALMQKNFDQAASFYEKGIEVDPLFPSNYYRAAVLYLNSNPVVWGTIYGELFMNLERNTQRTADMSKALLTAYKAVIKIEDGNPKSVSFCMNTDVGTNGRAPFCFVFEHLMLMSLVEEKGVDIGSLHQIRSNFLERYGRGFQESHPNVLFDYQQKIADAGHLEAYNYWILSQGDLEKFKTWQTANQKKWDGFQQWFNDNGLKLGSAYRFYRAQYN